MATSQLYHDAAAGNQKTWTFSAWIKRSNLGANSYLYSQGSSGSNYIGIYFGTNDEFKVYNEVSSSQTLYFVTNRLLRDTSAWYHIVVQCDTTQATESNRFKIWINGVQETSFSSASYPAQNSDTNMNAATRERIGVYHPAGSSPNHYWNGYMSHVALVDGSVVAPTVFGETDSTSGIWKFKPPSGFTWGTNGFHLKFENSAALGTDSSGQSNTFSVSGNLKQALDTPSNVYCTMNPLFPMGSAVTFSNGNTSISTSNTSFRMFASTLGISSGKFYWEMKPTPNVGGDYCHFGILDSNQFDNDTYVAVKSQGYVYLNDGRKNNNGTATSYGNSYTGNDIISVALDMDNKKLYFAKNGTWQNSGVPTSGSTGTGAAFTVATPDSGTYVAAVSIYAQSGVTDPTINYNFGNGFFGTTAITSAGSNGNGSLFEYDVPSGFYALNTKNINTYG